MYSLKCSDDLELQEKLCLDVWCFILGMDEMCIIEYKNKLNSTYRNNYIEDFDDNYHHMYMKYM